MKTKFFQACSCVQANYVNPHGHSNAVTLQMTTVVPHEQHRIAIMLVPSFLAFLVQHREIPFKQTHSTIVLSTQGQISLPPHQEKNLLLLYKARVHYNYCITHQAKRTEYLRSPCTWLLGGCGCILSFPLE